MQLNAIGILCADLEASLAFYRMIGVSFPPYDPSVGHYDADLGGGVRLMLDSHAVAQSFIEDWSPPRGNDQMSLAVQCESPRAVDQLYQEIVLEGYDSIREPFDAFWGQRYAMVSDPDGNQVDLYATLEEV